MTEEQLLKIGEWLNKRGYDLDLQDDFWMEDYLGDHKFRDLCDLLHEYAEEKLKHLHEHIENETFADHIRGTVYFEKEQLLEKIKQTIEGNE